MQIIIASMQSILSIIIMISIGYILADKNFTVCQKD